MSKVQCGLCNKGYIQAFSHVASGACFHCNGTGWALTSGTDYTWPTPTKEDIVKALNGTDYDYEVFCQTFNNKPEVYKMKVAFTGHRPTKLIGGYDDNSTGRKKLRQLIAVEISRINELHVVDMIITGGALGVDQDAARVAYALDLPYAVYAPCANHESKWPSQSQEKYRIMCELATDYRPSTKPYSARAMQERNEAMVDDCDILIAVWDGSNGGTGNCVRYAKNRGKTIVYINPSLCS